MRGWHHRHTQITTTALWMQYHEQVEVHYWESEQETDQLSYFSAGTLDGVPAGLVAGLTGRPHAVAGSLDRLPADNLLLGGKTSIQPTGHKTTKTRRIKTSYCLRGRIYYHCSTHKWKGWNYWYIQDRIMIYRFNLDYPCVGWIIIFILVLAYIY